jgi:hypothetical protein
MSEQETATTPAKKPGRSGAVWAVRVIVFGVLGALLIVAILEFRAKKQMGDTLAAIGDKLEVPDSKVTLKEAEDLVVGDPEVAEGKDVGGVKKKIYTWSGPLSRFRTYKLAVIYHQDFTKNKIVDKVTPNVDETE